MATKTTDVRLNTVTTLNSAESRGMGLDVGTIAMDSSYPTGGESLTFFNNTVAVMVQPRGGYVLDYDVTNSKLLAYRADNCNTVASGTVTPLVEVSNTFDLEALSTIPYVAVGWD